MIKKNNFVKDLFLVCFMFIALAPNLTLTGETIEDIYLQGLRSGQQGEMKAAELLFKNALVVARKSIKIPAMYQ